MLDLILGNLTAVFSGLGVIALGIAAFFIRKSGSDAQKAKQEKADTDAVITISREKNETHDMNETQLDKEFERWQKR